MKTYDEMKDNVFRRMDEYETKKKGRRKLYRRTALAVCPLCAAGIAVFTLWSGGFLGKDAGITISDRSSNAIAEGEKYAVTYDGDASEKKITMETRIAVSDTDRPTEQSSPKVSGASDSEVQPDTEDRTNSGADIPEEKNGTEEKTTASRVTTAAKSPAAKTTTSAAATAPVSNMWCIVGSSIEYNGRTYYDNDMAWAPAYTCGSYIGKVGDLPGSYEGNDDGGPGFHRISQYDSVYTVTGTSSVLLVVKENSQPYGSVIVMTNSDWSLEKFEPERLDPTYVAPGDEGSDPVVFNRACY